MKEDIIEHTAFAVSLFIFSIFGIGFQAVPVFVWLLLPTLLLYSRKQWKNVGIAYIANTLGLAMGYIGVLDIDPTLPRFQSAHIVLIASFVFNLILVASLAADRLAVQSQCVWFRILVFPTLWTGLWLLAGIFVGDYPTHSSSLMGWSDLIQVASLGGRPLIDFLVALFGTTVLELATLPALFKKASVPSEIVEDAIDGETLPSSSPFALHFSLAKHPFVLYSILMGLVAVYGGSQVNIHNGSMFQVAYSDYVPPSVPVGCLAGQSALVPQQDYTHWFNRSAELVQKGARLVLWSELTAFTTDEQDEAHFLELAKTFASTHHIYLAATYGTSGFPPTENRLVLISPEGQILINYNKAHPVPIVELQEPGEPVIQYVDTKEFGRIGVAICFDYNYAQFIWQAGRHKVDVMLQASQTWGPMGTYHAQQNAIRAVENGFTLFRCVSEGMSGVFEPTANGIFTQKNPTLTDEIRLFYLPLQKRINTLYGYIGDTFGYSCLIAGIVATGYLGWKEYKLKRDGQLAI